MYVPRNAEEVARLIEECDALPAATPENLAQLDQDIARYLAFTEEARRDA